MNTPEQDLRLAVARMAGLVLAFIVLTVGGGIALMVGAGVIFRFLYAG